MEQFLQILFFLGSLCVTIRSYQVYFQHGLLLSQEGNTSHSSKYKPSGRTVSSGSPRSDEACYGITLLSYKSAESKSDIFI